MGLSRLCSSAQSSLLLPLLPTWFLVSTGRPSFVTVLSTPAFECPLTSMSFRSSPPICHPPPFTLQASPSVVTTFAPSVQSTSVARSMFVQPSSSAAPHGSISPPVSHAHPSSHYRYPAESPTPASVTRFNHVSPPSVNPPVSSISADIPLSRAVNKMKLEI
ncbi:hypothetical protein FB451DRAFT_1299386 [Mycena latifolia]|nr:hypothetical protein FB451DRAFT_1299386 [Mycena latifolia]